MNRKPTQKIKVHHEPVTAKLLPHKANSLLIDSTNSNCLFTESISPLKNEVQALVASLEQNKIILAKTAALVSELQDSIRTGRKLRRKTSDSHAPKILPFSLIDSNSSKANRDIA
jgi:hypothetical protein